MRRLATRWIQRRTKVGSNQETGVDLVSASRDRSGPRVCWLPLLPTELRIQLLHTIAAQEDGARAALMLGTEFPEFGRLVLAVGSKSTAILMDTYTTGSEIMKVYVPEYAQLAKHIHDDRPVRIIFTTSSQEEPGGSLPFRLLDGSLYSVVSRLIILDPSSRFYVMGPEQCYSPCYLPHGDHRKQIMKSTSSSSTLILDYSRLLQGRRKKRYKVDENFEFIPVKIACALGCHTKWKLEDKQEKLSSLVAYNCPYFHVEPLSKYGLHDLEVYLSPRTDTLAEYEHDPQTVCLSVFPISLQITFESFSLPIITVSPQCDLRVYLGWPGCGRMFVLHNSCWSPTQPYGMTKKVLVNGSLVEIDQATYNSRVAWGLEIQGQQANISLPLRPYRSVYLYGVPDSSVAWSSLSTVRDLFWWRLTPKVVGVDELPINRAILWSPILERLLIVGVFKKNDCMPLFKARKLKVLELVTLHDSDVPLSADKAIDGETPLLTHVYLERRTDADKEPAPGLKMTTRELQKVSPNVVSLHVRGYVPVFAMPGYDQPTVEFLRLLELTLDLSEIAEVALGGHGVVTLAFEAESFPKMQTVRLMCSREAHSRGALSEVNLKVLVGKRCFRVFVSDLLRPLSLELNGERLEVVEEQYHRYPTYPTPVVPSRKCRLWERKIKPSTYEIGALTYAGEAIILDNYLFKVREY